MAATSSAKRGKPMIRGGDGSGYFSETSSESCVLAAESFRIIHKETDLVITEDLAIEASLALAEPAAPLPSLVDGMSENEEQVLQEATRCLDQPSLIDDLTTVSSSLKCDIGDLLQGTRNENDSEVAFLNLGVLEAKSGLADLRNYDNKDQLDNSPKDTLGGFLNAHDGNVNATIDAGLNEPMARAKQIPRNNDDKNRPMLSVDTKSPHEPRHAAVPHETLGKECRPKDVCIGRCEPKEEKKTDDWSCGILPSFSDLTASSNLKMEGPVLSSPAGFPSINMAGALDMPFSQHGALEMPSLQQSQTEAMLPSFAPCDLNGPNNAVCQAYATKTVMPTDHPNVESDCIVVSRTEWNRRNHEAEIRMHQLALLANTVSMLEAKLNMFRHELKNRKALTEKTSLVHCREMEEVHRHYLSLLQVKDERIEILIKAHEKERLERNFQQEQAGFTKEPTTMNEDNLGQEMDTLQSEINRIADAYAKFLAREKGSKQLIQPRARPDGPRSRYIVFLFIAILFGTIMAGIYLLEEFHKHLEVGFDFLCSPALPGTRVKSMDGTSATFEAPWWVPSHSTAKADVFNFVCGSRDRLHLSWEPYASKGRGSLKLNKLEHGVEVSIWTRHIVSSVEINSDHVKILHQTGNVERLPLY